MSEQEYKKLVLAHYEGLVKTGALSSELLSPTPGNIKAQVLKTLGEGLDSKDEKTLRSFVGSKADVGEYYKVVDITSADLYRPLVKALKERSVNTNLRNADLLAWLIDYKPRPFRPDLVAPIRTEPPAVEPAPPTSTNKAADAKQPSLVKKRIGFIAGSTLIVLLLAAIVIWRHENQLSIYRCMIWDDDDHYEPIDCKDQSINAPHYHINRELVNNFKRITRPDTLTYRSIHKVWYSNYKGKVEFYTDSGANPLDTNFRVLPMTTHILEKYVLHITN
ncbi:MAG TPA: hypothetical protein VGM63_13100 [Mucilaginibacter sp.]|jgi:hypothetical protein